MTRTEALQFLITNLAVWPEFAKDGPQLPGFNWVDCDDDPPYLSCGGGVWPIDVTEWLKLRNVAQSAPHVGREEMALRMRAAAAMGAPYFPRSVIESAMRMRIAAARSGGEFVLDELILTASQLNAYQQAARELSLVSGKELVEIYFKECVK